MRTRLLAGLMLVVLLAGLSPSFALAYKSSPDVTSHDLVFAPPATGVVRSGVVRRPAPFHASQPALVSTSFVALTQAATVLAQASPSSVHSADLLGSNASRAPPA